MSNSLFRKTFKKEAVSFNHEATIESDQENRQTTRRNTEPKQENKKNNEINQPTNDPTKYAFVASRLRLALEAPLLRLRQKPVKPSRGRIRSGHVSAMLLPGAHGFPRKKDDPAANRLRPRARRGRRLVASLRGNGNGKRLLFHFRKGQNRHRLPVLSAAGKVETAQIPRRREKEEKGHHPGGPDVREMRLSHRRRHPLDFPQERADGEIRHQLGQLSALRSLSLGRIYFGQSR